jgi:hypothetical protein
LFGEPRVQRSNKSRCRTCTARAALAARATMTAGGATHRPESPYPHRRTRDGPTPCKRCPRACPLIQPTPSPAGAQTRITNLGRRDQVDLRPHSIVLPFRQHVPRRPQLLQGVTHPRGGAGEHRLGRHAGRERAAGREAAEAVGGEGGGDAAEVGAGLVGGGCEKTVHEWVGGRVGGWEIRRAQVQEGRKSNGRSRHGGQARHWGRREWARG